MKNLKLSTIMYLILLSGFYLTNLMTVGLIAINIAPNPMDVDPIMEVLMVGIAFPPLGILLGASEIGYALQIF